MPLVYWPEFGHSRFDASPKWSKRLFNLNQRSETFISLPNGLKATLVVEEGKSNSRLDFINEK